MRKNPLFYALLAIGILVASCKQKPANKTGEVYPVASLSGNQVELDLEKSIIRWKGSKVTGTHNGTVNLKSGVVSYSGGNITGGNFVIDMPTIVVLDLTGEYKQKLEGHLKTSDFFEVEKYPEGKFEIASVTPIETGGYEVRGNLTLRGISKGIEFPAQITFNNGKPEKAEAEVRINRQEWGVSYKGKQDDLISDIIELNLELYTK